MNNRHTIGASVEVVIATERLGDPDYMDGVITVATRTFRDKFIMAVEAAEDDPEGTFTGEGTSPL